MNVCKLFVVLLSISLSLSSEKADGSIRGIVEKSVSTTALFSLVLHEIAQLNRNSVVQFVNNSTASLTMWDYVSMYTPGFNDSSIFRTSGAGRVKSVYAFLATFAGFVISWLPSSESKKSKNWRV